MHQLITDTQLLDVRSGRELTIRQLTGGQPTLVVFTRHLHCMFCELHIEQIVRRSDELGRIILVGFASPEATAELAERLPPEITVLVDRSRKTYRAAGLQRGGAWRVIWNPKQIAIGGWLLARRRFRDAQWVDDRFQLGGDLVLRADASVAWIHRCSGPEDRPTVDRLLLEIDAAHADRGALTDAA